MDEHIQSGIPGLDRALGGGFPGQSMVIVEGEPGTGKTTMGLQFISVGARDYHEPGIYVSLEEPPEQIYQSAAEFSFDLRQLEDDNLVRVVGCSPRLFMDQLQGVDGTLRKLIHEIGAKRMVVDPINLLRMADESHHDRITFYSLLQALRRLSLTVLLTYERMNDDDYLQLEHFVCDGIIRLGMQEREDTFGRRTLRVAKLRHNASDAREYVFRISSAGMYVASPMGTVDDSHSVQPSEDYLGQVLSQTLAKGTITLFDVSSLVNLLPLKRAVILHRIAQGDSRVVWSLSASTTINNFLTIAPEVQNMFSDGRLYFVEHFRRPFVSTSPNVLHAFGLGPKAYREMLSTRLVTKMTESMSNGEQWFLGYDVNDVQNLLGADFVVSIFPEILAFEKTLGLTAVIFANLREITPNLRAMLERTSDNVIRIWVERGYQYMQVVKAKEVWPTRPFIVETQAKTMDLRLL